MCGTRLTQTCTICGAVVSYLYHYCSRCGAQLTPILTDAARAAATGTRATQQDDGGAPVDLGQSPSLHPEQPAEEALLSGERRVATIILADVQGSTDLLEKVGSERWVEMMNHVFKLLEAEIYRFGGTVDQFRGDGLVAFFGTVVAHEDDPERGVLTALAMQRAIGVYAAELARRESIDLSLRVGVNTGEVIVANVGDDQTHSEDTAMGEAIALAARMEQAAEAGTVLVSESTYHLVEGQFDWLALGEIQVKGISHPVSVYRPLASRLSPEQSQEYDVITPLIGREAELATLVDCVDELREGRGGILMVTGERGMGKSVLLQEFRRHLARQEALLAEVSIAELPGGDDADPELLDELRAALGPEPRTRELRGRARSYDQSQPYAMWHDLMQHWLGIRKDESKENIRDRLRVQVEALWGDSMTEIYPDLAKFLGLPSGTVG